MNDNKQKDYSELEIFSEASSMSAELRESIKQMSRYYRFDIGDELRKLLRQIKYLIADASGKIEIKGKYEAVQELLETISHIEIALQDCLEDNALSVSGRYNINQPLIRLSKIKDQATIGGEITCTMFMLEEKSKKTNLHECTNIALFRNGGLVSLKQTIKKRVLCRV